MVQWLGLWASTAGGIDVISDWGTKILQALLWHNQKVSLNVCKFKKKNLGGKRIAGRNAHYGKKIKLPYITKQPH